MKVHGFNEKKKFGKLVEAAFDDLFSAHFDIEPVTLAEEKALGIDRRFTWNRPGPACGIRCTVEYKGDAESANTGNLFLETVSNDETGAPGWMFKSEAQVLAYAFQEHTTVEYFWFDMGRLKSHFRDWLKRYRIGSSYNHGYCTKGLCVPIGVVETEFPSLRSPMTELVVVDGEWKRPAPW